MSNVDIASDMAQIESTADLADEIYHILDINKDLLAALDKACKLINDGPGNCPAMFCHECYIDAAIAKARGES